MRATILGFAAGCGLVQQTAQLPDARLCALLAAALGAGCVLNRLKTAPGGSFGRASESGSQRLVATVMLSVIGLLLGLGYASGRAELRIADALNPSLQGRDLLVSGIVRGLPQRFDGAQRFVFDVDPPVEGVPQRIQLSWYPPRGDHVRPPVVQAGARWQLRVRLKQPHGFANPDGFDYEYWLLERGIRATGYVRQSDDNRRLDPAALDWRARVDRLREGVRTRMTEVLPDGRYAGVLVALAVGDQRGIDDAQWEVFRRTGVAHLVSISGLHVSLVAVFAGGIAGWLWRRSSRLMLAVPVRRASAVVGLGAAAAYALMAGMGLPVQRALTMLGVAALALAWRRNVSPTRVFSIALLCVLIVDPWAMRSPGLWLSFGAVAVILLIASGRLHSVPGWRLAVRTQLAITVGLLPLLVALFNQASLASPLANAVAIPMVSFAIAPLVLLAMLFPWSFLLSLAHGLTSVMMAALEWLAAQGWAAWSLASPPAGLWLAGLFGVFWSLLPQGTPARLAALCALLPVLSWSPARPAPGEWGAIVLEVGHGLAIHVQTAQHDLLYDTGPRYGGMANAGERVILPYLRAHGITALDRLMISHDDIDHSGGAESVLTRVPVARVLADLPPEHRVRTHRRTAWEACTGAEEWEWDGVAFEVLHPLETSVRKDNDASCVLKLTSAAGSMLITGDIERSAELELLRHADRLRSEVVIVPHHGSRSSSSKALVEAVGAGHALFAVGHRNPFRHPHPQVVDRWAQAGARVWRTDEQGALSIRAAASGLSVQAQRELRRRYWHGR